MLLISLSWAFPEKRQIRQTRKERGSHNGHGFRIIQALSTFPFSFGELALIPDIWTVFRGGNDK
jgi:hypothetical protein